MNDSNVTMVKSWRETYQLQIMNHDLMILTVPIVYSQDGMDDQFANANYFDHGTYVKIEFLGYNRPSCMKVSWGFQ